MEAFSSDHASSQPLISILFFAKKTLYLLFLTWFNITHWLIIITNSVSQTCCHVSQITSAVWVEHSEGECMMANGCVCQCRSWMCRQAGCTNVSGALVAAHCISVSSSVMKLEWENLTGHGRGRGHCHNLALIQNFPKCDVRWDMNGFFPHNNIFIVTYARKIFPAHHNVALTEMSA